MAESSTAWKVLHNLLPTEQRLARILPNTSDSCKHCTDISANLVHCLFHCVHTKESGDWILSVFHIYDSNVTADKLVRLELEVTDTMELPIVWFAANAMRYVQLGVQTEGDEG